MCVVKGGSSARDSAPPPVLLITHASASRKYVLSATCSSSTLYILPTKHNDFTTITIQIKYFTFIIKQILWVQQILTIKKRERDINLFNNVGLVRKSFHFCKL